MATLYGYEGELYYKIGGVAGGGSFTLLENVTDVTIGRSKNEAKVTTRSDGAFEAMEPIRTAIEISFEMIVDDDDQNYLDLRDADADGSVIGIKALKSANGNGFQTDFKIFDFSETEPLDDVQKVSVTLKRVRGYPYEAISAS